MALNSIHDIKHCTYINLLSRQDRRIHIEKQLNLLGLNGTRFNALKLQNGAIGCSMSHLKCLENAKKMNLPHILILEDDITFLQPELFIQQLNLFLKNHSTWDVLLFAGNNMPPYTKIDSSCVKVQKCQTTTGYLVKNHYYDKLINNFKEGINNLLKYPNYHRIYAIDKYWFSLQEVDNWYLITPLTVVQREDYSDIEKKKTNYTKIMVDLDKKYLLTNLNHSALQPKSSSLLAKKLFFT
jgi:GR25 family glycosyltransferase involved in LPS biosynthesis